MDEGPSNVPSGDFVTVNQIERAQKTFFYVKKDGTLFACTEQEAALYGRNYTQIGVSDGTTYQKYLREHVKKGQVFPREEARKILQDAFDAELEMARGHFQNPKYANVSFDSSFPMDQRHTFIPPR